MLISAITNSFSQAGNQLWLDCFVSVRSFDWQSGGQRGEGRIEASSQLVELIRLFQGWHE
jgi:hypothetical protein